MYINKINQMFYQEYKFKLTNVVKPFYNHSVPVL